MLELEGYSDISLVYTGKSFALFRGVQSAVERLPVLIKTFSTDFPRREEYGYLRQDYELAENLQPAPLLKPLEMRQEGKRMYTVWQDAPGLPLKKFISENNLFYLDYNQALQVFCSLTSALGVLHKKNLVVRGLHPAQILFDPEEGATRLSGLGYAAYTTADMPPLPVERFETEGLAYYMAPEQTGRMAAPVDQRADLYALGVLFFECLTRQLPFPQSDFPGLIHAHLAQEAPDVRQLNPAVPKALALLVQKLLSKNAADRYQSARGLLSDLEKCKALIRKGEESAHFVPGQEDVSDIFQLPEKTYGRSDALKRLTIAFERSQERSFEAVFVSGPSGMGKSTLVREAWARADKTDTYFLTGTFKSYNKNVPYSGVTEALRGMVDHILALPESEARIWKDRIRQALGDQGALMTNIIPELELLIGKQAPMPDEATPEAAEQRLMSLFLQLISALTRSNKKLAFFIDDLHLAEPASIGLLQNLMNNRDQNKMLLIGAFVDDDPGKLHPFLHGAAPEVPVTEIRLSPLSKEDIRALIAEALHSAAEKTNGVVDVLYYKTKGIPIFLREFLNRANREGAIYFDYDHNTWQWDRDRIEQMPISGNVAELMLTKARQLPGSTLNLLQQAACIGVHFDLDTLQALSGRPPGETVLHLGVALQEGYIRLRDEPIGLQATGGKWYSFTHDRLQQAVYLMADPSWRSLQHFRTAGYLQRRYGMDDAILYATANHLLAGMPHLDTPDIKADAKQVFFAAGKKARLAASYALAYQYFDAARQMLRADCWEQDYANTYALYNDLIECAYIAGPKEAGPRLFDAAFPKINGSLDRARLHLARMEAFIYLTEMRASFEAGQAALAELGNRLPERPAQPLVLVELLKTTLLLGTKSFESILALPEQSDPKTRLRERIYFLALQYAYSNSNELFAIISLRMQRQSLRKGLSVYSYSGFSLYAAVLSLGFGRYLRGFEYLELALKIAQKNGAPVAIGGARFALGLSAPFVRPLPECLNYFETAFGLLQRAGDVTSTVAAAFNIMSYNLLLATPLQTCRDINAYYLGQVQTNKQALGIELQQWYGQFIDLLLYPRENRELPDPQVLVAEKYGSFSENYKSMYFVQWMQLYYWFGRYDNALSIARIVATMEQAFVFHITHPEFYFVRALAIARQAERNDADDRKDNLKHFRKALRLLAKLNRYAPANFHHKYLAVQGALHLYEGNALRALTSFQEALAVIPKGYYYHDIAAISELAAYTALRLGRLKEVSGPIERARLALETWGAQALCRRLKADWAVVGGFDPDMPETTAGTGTVDFKAVLKASQLLSGEIELSALLDDLIRIAMENAGAQRGFLVVEQNKRLLIAAEGDAVQQQVQVYITKPLEEGQLPESIVQYVARTQKPLTLSDAGRDERFATDSYIIEFQPKSVLCRPILHQNKLIGILYLENNLAYGAFTSERQEALALLSGQAAISLQNAYLYEQLTSLNQSYARFVPKELLNLLGKESILEVSTGDHVQREMTVMFADIRQFTALSERLSPSDNFRFINDYLSAMEPCILRRGGFIDKYIGDAIMALFPGSADDALQAALDMLEALETFNQTQAEPVRIGIGLNTGSLILGTVGSAQRMDGTVISDAVNVAARVENLTKRYGANLLITADTYLKLEKHGRFPIRVLDQANVEGKTEKVTLYEVCAGSGAGTDALKIQYAATFEEGVMLFHSGDIAEAAQRFAGMVEVNPADKPAAYWLKRCAG